jgi:hypothetical protein
VTEVAFEPVGDVGRELPSLPVATIGAAAS